MVSIGEISLYQQQIARIETSLLHTRTQLEGAHADLKHRLGQRLGDYLNFWNFGWRRNARVATHNLAWER